MWPPPIAFSTAKTLLLSAGPRAGKTSCLYGLRAEAKGPCAYISVTPEDAEPEFFVSRFLVEYPAIAQRYEALRATHGVAGGALLGRAIAETYPGFCMLVDDFHLAEGTPLEAELLSLFRHLPHEGSLVVASRHRFPEIRRWHVQVHEADDPMWRESPAAEDLDALPAALVAKILVLHLLGEGSPTPSGWELIRRNVACEGEGGYHYLRMAWSKVADEALSRRLVPGVWELLAEELVAFRDRHRRTEREQRVLGILARVPAEERRRYPGLLLLDGDAHLEVRDDLAARACYQRALAMAPGQSLRNELILRLLRIAIRRGEAEAVTELIGALEMPGAALLPAQEVELHFLRGLLAWNTGDMGAAVAAMESVWSVPDAGERRVLWRRFQALYSLCSLHVDLGEPREALGYAEPMVTFAEAHGFQRDLMSAYSARISCLFLDESAKLPLRALTELPTEGVRSVSPYAFHDYLSHFGVRAFRLGVYPLCLAYFDIFAESARAHRLTSEVEIARFWQMRAHARMGEFEQAKVLYGDLRATLTNQRLLHGVLAMWGRILIEAGRLDDAERHLQTCLSLFEGGPDRAQMELYRDWGRHQQGDPGARDRIRALLATPDGGVFWDGEARLLERLGLRSLPPILQVRAFGGLFVGVPGESPIHWPRRKPLSLLAHLLRSPEGLAIEELVDRLYRGSRNSDPEGALHTLAYGLRQGLKAIEADSLLEFSDDSYRWRAERVDFCDVHEFDRLYQKAQALEEDGLEAPAAIFYRMALALVQGPLFEDLPDDFRAERAHYEACVRHAEAFAWAHRF